MNIIKNIFSFAYKKHNITISNEEKIQILNNVDNYNNSQKKHIEEQKKVSISKNEIETIINKINNNKIYIDLNVLQSKGNKFILVWFIIIPALITLITLIASNINLMDIHNQILLIPLCFIPSFLLLISICSYESFLGEISTNEEINTIKQLMTYNENNLLNTLNMEALNSDILFHMK